MRHSGASKPEPLEDSLKGVEFTLDAEEMEACDNVWYRLPREKDAQIARRCRSLYLGPYCPEILLISWVASLANGVIPSMARADALKCETSFVASP